MVANPGGVDTPIGVWLDADAAPIVGNSKTGRPQVKNGGKGTQGGSGTLAYRPGWHLGLIPYAIQFNRKDENGEKTLFPKDFVWAEVEYAADKNYQKEAEAEGYTDNGKYRHSYAGLKHLPTDGYYIYRTNPNPDTDPWIITGAMKVNRILSNDEVDDLVRKAGREPQRREGEGLGELEDMSFEGLGSRLYGGVEQPSSNTYRMLGRLKSDCDYYLGHGNRYAGNLYYHNEVLQIKGMIEIWDSLPDDKKPEWLTIDQLEKYSVELTGKTIEEFKKEYMSDDISEADDDYKASKYFGLKVAENKDELERGINEILSQYASREMASNQAINYMDESPEISKEWLRENGLKSRDDFKKWAANRQSKVRKPILEKQEKELKEAKKTIADIRVANILKKAHEEAERWDREHNEDKMSDDISEAEKEKLRSYKGNGGKKDTTDRGILDEFYTPEYVCEFMYQLAVKYGYKCGKVLEPSIAIGNCIRPIYERNDYTHIDSFEINETSREICKKLYPNVTIYPNYFETAFLEPPRFSTKAKKTWLPNAPYDLAIGNPPYGKHVNRYSSYFTGKDKFAQTEMFFIYESLKLLRPGGLLVFITSTNFMSTGNAYQQAKERIEEIADLVDAYRLPKVFDKTDICTDIIVLRKK